MNIIRRSRDAVRRVNHRPSWLTGRPMQFDAEYDFVIVGAGSAGCVLANGLSADPAARVLVIEAGGRDTNPWIHIPAGFHASQTGASREGFIARSARPAIRTMRFRLTAEPATEA